MSDDTFKQIIKTLNASPVKDHADAIGMVCVLWGKLEMQLDILLVGLLDCEVETMAAILPNMKMREKINTIRILAHQKKPSQDWYRKLDKNLSEIDTKIRLRRNRLIHDYWLDSDEKILQVQMLAKVIKPQSRQTQVIYDRVTETSVGEIMALQVMILVATASVQETIRLRANELTPLPDKH